MSDLTKAIDLASHIDILAVPAVRGTDKAKLGDPKETGEDLYELKRLLASLGYSQNALWHVLEAYMEQSRWHLRQDSFTQAITFDGSVYDSGDLLAKLTKALGAIGRLPVAIWDAQLRLILKRRQSNPVQGYLRGLGLAYAKAKTAKLALSTWLDSDMSRLEHQVHSSLAQDYLRANPDEIWEGWDNLAKTLFGSEDPLSQTLLAKWLISAVARAMQPGCQADSAIVLVGGQGLGKTECLRVLFGDHFRTLHSHLSTTEQQRIMQQSWGCELGEIEATFRAKDIAALKAFLTERSDSVRGLYEKAPKDHPRHMVFAGTTNEAKFLTDPTGSRRFWTIQVNHQVPLEWLRTNRDNIWRTAMQLYGQRQPWWLTQDETDLAARVNQGYAQENPFEQPLDTALSKLEPQHGPIAITASDCLTYLLGIRPENHKKHQKDLAVAMTNLGYIRKQFSSKAIKGWHYVKPDQDRYEPFRADFTDLLRTH